MPVKNGTDSKKSLLQNQFGMPLNVFSLLSLKTEPCKRKERRINKTNNWKNTKSLEDKLCELKIKPMLCLYDSAAY